MKTVREILDNTDPVYERYVELLYDFGDELADYLDSSITFEELCEKIDMSEQRLADIFSGNANITLKEIARIETALGVKLITIGE